MNIFKVIASGKRKLNEEQMSAVLAWFLHPNMEHGLGYEFLNRFLKGIWNQNSSQAMQYLVFRSHGDSTFSLDLEEHVSGDKRAFIDIVFQYNGQCVAIENKIHQGSARDASQLEREYSGLASEYPDHQRTLVYLVPAMDGILDRDAEKMQSLFLSENHSIEAGSFVTMTWQKIDNYPSIESIIIEILEQESRGEIEPINEYTRHTLKAWLTFIRSGFKGYDYARDASERPGTQRLKYKEILNTSEGFVGLRGGIPQLAAMSGKQIMERDFAYTSERIAPSSSWMPIETFKVLCNWRIQGVEPKIDWPRAKYDSMTLYDIAKTCCPQQSIFIGIKGGANALRNMDYKEIQQKSWQMLTSNEALSSQWIEGELYREILDEKEA